MAFGLGKSSRRRELTRLIDEDMVGLLEPGVEFEGKLTVTSGILRLNTHIKGQIESAATVIVADKGQVEGEIRSRLISVTGMVKGTVHATERLEIKEHGIVHGDIYTPCLVVDPGGYFEGQCHMPAPEPTPEVQTDLKPESSLISNL
jgi:cytoskeletal protein CcmA (bactofilin family)